MLQSLQASKSHACQDKGQGQNHSFSIVALFVLRFYGQVTALLESEVGR